MRHVTAWKCWMAWDGRRWCRDDTELATNLAREVCWRAAASVRNKAPMAAGVIHRLNRAGTILQVERLARADRHAAATPALFDADPNLLNTPDGIVELRTGNIGPHRRDAFLTRMAATAPAAAGTPCPVWWSWLARMCGGDDALLLHLQRVAGRALVRRRTQGKPSAPAPHSLFVATLTRILGDDSAEAALRECLDPLPQAVRNADAMCDPELEDRLEAEYPAILRWAVEGTTAWRAHGLATPDSVRQDIASDAGGDDALDRWLAEQAERSPGAWEGAGHLYDAWLAWAAALGLDAGSQKRFGQMLAARGFVPTRHHGGRRGFAGIRLGRKDAVEAMESLPNDELPVAAATADSSPRVTTTTDRESAGFVRGNIAEVPWHRPAGTVLHAPMMACAGDPSPRVTAGGDGGMSCPEPSLL